METRGDAVASLRSAHVQEPAVVPTRSRLDLIPYGIVMGLVTTAVGALVAERWAGTARLAVWSIVTTILAFGAILLAGPALDTLGRFLRGIRGGQ
jgi:uncharacterized membrane protein